MAEKKTEKLNLKRFKFNIKNKKLKYVFLSLAAFVTLFLLIFGGYSIIYAKKIYARQYIGDMNLSYKTKDQAKKSIKEKADTFNNSQFEIESKNQAGVLNQSSISPKEIGLNYDIDATVEKVWLQGRNKKAISSFWQQLRSLFVKNQVDAQYVLNEEALNSTIKSFADKVDTPEKDFAIEYQNNQFNLSTEKKDGERIDQKELLAKILTGIKWIKKNDIKISSKKFKPQISEEKAKKRLDQANRILLAGDLILEYSNNQYGADNDMIGGFVQYQGNGDDLELKFNDERIQLFVDSIKKVINTEPANAKLSVVNGNTVIASMAGEGKTLNEAQTKNDIKNTILKRIDQKNPVSDKIALQVILKQPEINNDISKLGIVELVGTATTDFRKSPSNRIHNITIGANALNGMLIKPGETFSTLAQLGKIDASTGYLQELVIKEDKTVPEFGGGLCQVSSTLFRAAINSGLKIVERQNHKYRVSYYEPPVGMDATIYDPAPDLKFINNYGSHILIQSRVSGTKITFDFYGTKDSRELSISTPELYDVTDPGPPVMAETDTLAAGERKQIEKAHQGGTARFKYKVTRAGEVLDDKTFVSKYVSWPEKWLVGKGTVVPPAPTPEPAPLPPEPTPIPTPTCSDGVQNGDETGVDCGGSCPACPITPPV